MAPPQLLGRDFHSFPEVDSTNRTLRDLARGGASEGTVVVAERQTVGRGRLDRAWHSPPGGLYLSVLLQPVPLLSLRLGVAAARAVEETCGFGPELKWPNDLLSPRAVSEANSPGTEPPLGPRPSRSEAKRGRVGGLAPPSAGPLSPPPKRWTEAIVSYHFSESPAPVHGGKKLGGVLIEMEGPWAVAGVGINVETEEFTSDIASTATSLRLLGHRVSPSDLGRVLLRELEGLYRGPFRLAYYEARCGTLGRRVSVETPTGTVTGVARRLDPDGALVVETGSGEVRVLAGDVVHLR